ncbi:hypothetical protein P152DRAFT_124117 [Eremomyces bilateralis CBS 781.70]|uniref:Uncharacterized protein n=1 Tax=Eremomyces bilateralis CBS 781.70 TaxID=1392243 RepID=A0A6G1GEJ6_9PEZI|nr:uncharacterized protein P152DRAFT_124117 [Eremomyces bilateralis CBS 781.70]KAF1816442.1 hypothetical protein P152DRAFT_124117 [Eremomyces bilateralis CBS 781.70]
MRSGQSIRAIRAIQMVALGWRADRPLRCSLFIIYHLSLGIASLKISVEVFCSHRGFAVYADCGLPILIQSCCTDLRTERLLGA